MMENRWSDRSFCRDRRAQDQRPARLLGPDANRRPLCFKHCMDGPRSVGRVGGHAHGHPVWPVIRPDAGCQHSRRVPFVPGSWRQFGGPACLLRPDAVADWQFHFLWGLKDRGNETRHELHLKELVQQSLVVGRPAPFLSELIAEAESKPEAKASFGRFARNTLLALGISSALSIGLLAVAFWASDEFDRVRAGILAIIPCVVAVAALIKTVSEALSTSPQNRSTPERAVEAYVSMVKQQRWPEAMSCLSWITGHARIPSDRPSPNWT